MEYFNELDPSEAERLFMLIEEAAEVVQSANAVLLGYSPAFEQNDDSEKPTSLVEELGELAAIGKWMQMDEIESENDIEKHVTKDHWNRFLSSSSSSHPDQQATRVQHISSQAGTLIQAATKVLRHGYESCHPHYTERGTNREQLGRAVAEMITLIRACDITCDPDAIIAGKLYWTHHQGSVKPIGENSQPD